MRQRVGELAGSRVWELSSYFSAMWGEREGWGGSVCVWMRSRDHTLQSTESSNTNSGIEIGGAESAWWLLRSTISAASLRRVSSFTVASWNFEFVLDNLVAHVRTRRCLIFPLPSLTFSCVPFLSVPASLSS